MNNELFHHGVLGMKWGVRRYQNPDGSLTSAGKRKYGTKEHFDARQDFDKKRKQFRNDSTRSNFERTPMSGLWATKKGRQRMRDHKRIAWESEKSMMAAKKRLQETAKEARHERNKYGEKSIGERIHDHRKYKQEQRALNKSIRKSSHSNRKDVENRYSNQLEGSQEYRNLRRQADQAETRYELASSIRKGTNDFINEKNKIDKNSDDTSYKNRRADSFGDTLARESTKAIEESSYKKSREATSRLVSHETRVGRDYVHAMNQALLDDIGYKGSYKQGKAMLKKYKRNYYVDSNGNLKNRKGVIGFFDTGVRKGDTDYDYKRRY